MKEKNYIVILTWLKIVSFLILKTTPIAIHNYIFFSLVSTCEAD